MTLSLLAQNVIMYNPRYLLLPSQQRICWQMFFDGASQIVPKGTIIAGVGVVFISPQNYILPRAFSLTESCSNNVAEYNALLIGLQLAHGMGVRYLEAYVIQN